MKLLVEIAPGELLDKLTILEIKSKMIKDVDKLKNINKEYDLLFGKFLELKNECDDNISKEATRLLSELKKINAKIWDIEDDIRNCERKNSFNEHFIQLARSVYHTNDKRASIKKEINILFQSDIAEEKSYTSYVKKTSAENVKECNKLTAKYKK